MHTIYIFHSLWCKVEAWRFEKVREREQSTKRVMGDKCGHNLRAAHRGLKLRVERGCVTPSVLALERLEIQRTFGA